jgi:hypothetical protein
MVGERRAGLEAIAPGEGIVVPEGVPSSNPALFCAFTCRRFPHWQFEKQQLEHGLGQ